jgi:hypothetical protein
MVISIGFDHLKFLGPTLGDRNHHQSLMSTTVRLIVNYSPGIIYLLKLFWWGPHVYIWRKDYGNTIHMDKHEKKQQTDKQKIYERNHDLNSLLILR